MRFTVIDNETGLPPDLQKIALEESWTSGLIHCDIDGFFIGEDGALILMDDCGNACYCPAERFKIIYEEDKT